MKCRQLPEIKIIYMRRVGEYGIENKYLMERFKEWLKNNNLFGDESIILAIPRDNPQTTQPENCRYDVALIVESFEMVEGLAIDQAVLAAGTYAIFSIEHTEEAISQTMTTMFTEIANAGLTVNEQLPMIERYAVKKIEKNQCEICVPVN